MLEVEDGLQLVHCDADDREVAGKLRKYLQHVGCGVSSRQAEALLVQFGCLAEAFAEARFEGDARAEVTGRLAELYGCPVEDVRLYSSGMSAFYAGFRAVQTVQRARGRTRWVQLGWLYLDSGCVLKHFLGDDESLEYCYSVMDTEAVIDQLSAAGETLAGVVVECPVNPLVQICDLKRIAEAVRACGGVLMVDPTVASIYNMDVLRYSDIVVTSLTKYAAHEGDVMTGSVALNADSRVYAALSAVIDEVSLPPYAGDLARLAQEMQDAPEQVARINANAARLAAFLQQHPAVKSVAYTTDSPQYPAVARSEASGGGMISIELAGSMEHFHDRIKVFKGPSFGVSTTLLSPFMYLAHYDLVTDDAGCAFLDKVGIAPDLIRISVGVEPFDDIRAVFAAALQK